MNSGANRSFDRSTPKSLALGNNGRLYLAIRTAISFRACVFFLVVTLVNLFQVVVVAAAEHSNSEGLVDIGGGRKMYVKCSGRGSSTIVLVGGLRASAVEATWNEDSHWWFVSLRHPSGTISNWTVDADARDYHYVCKN